jgi:hypothetical protein
MALYQATGTAATTATTLVVTMVLCPVVVDRLRLQLVTMAFDACVWLIVVLLCSIVCMLLDPVAVAIAVVVVHAWLLLVLVLLIVAVFRTW